jgi:hypothetical protein
MARTRKTEQGTDESVESVETIETQQVALPEGQGQETQVEQVEETTNGTVDVNGVEWTPERRQAHGELIRSMYREGKIKGRVWTKPERDKMSDTLKEGYATGRLTGRVWTEEEKQAHRERMNIRYWGDPRGRVAVESDEVLTEEDAADEE